ncbi:MAG: DUF2083 domain-containing protein [Acidobacteria bacterium]|nr:DUF2083 domain-containing protein [Acidobacteriota bacterium]
MLPARKATRLGPRLTALRRQHQLTQAKLAARLGISPSYLNLIENGRRPLSAELLIRLAQAFHLDLKELAGEDDERLAADLLEIFGDDLFDGSGVTPADLRSLSTSHPAAARALVKLYQAYQGARASAQTLAERMSETGGLEALDSFRLPPEEVSDLIQRHGNHFPELEADAERLWDEARFEGEDLFQALARYLFDSHGVKVRIEKFQAMHGAVRRYDPARRELVLSEVLRRGSRNFQLAHQVGLLTEARVLDRLARDRRLTTTESRALCRIALANYFAAAVLMPYGRFLAAAREERYDLELLGHRFRASFEQVCHRLTSLRRPGAEGVPFHLVRVDVAGNISKRFSASGIQIARYSGACPRWIIHSAYLTPGMVRVQVSRMPDGTTYFCIARTLEKDRGGYHAPHAVQAIEIGCPLQHAGELVYADGMDLQNLGAAVPVGVTCRLCERVDCEQRAFPALQTRLRIDENVRGVAFYAPVD